MRNNRTPVFCVDLDRLDSNLHVLCSHAKITPERVIAVVKDNGYGIGSIEMARSLSNQGVSHFAVAALDEALFLRENDICGAIILLGYSSKDQIELAILNDISLSIIDPTQFEPFVNQLALPDIHLLIDTGMHRNGIRFEEILSGMYDSYLQKLGEKIVGLYTHYHSSDQIDQSSVIEQHSRLMMVKAYLTEKGINPAKVHSSNSGAVLYGTVSDTEMVRFGIGFHGVGREICPDLREVTSIESVVTSIREVPAGEGVCYNHLYRPLKNSRVATVPIGYGDGYNRAFTGKSWAIINGVKYPIVARVTMDYVVVDIESAEVQIGDPVTLIGESGSESITVVELASAIGTIPYEILCTCGAGMDHRYLRSGKTVGSHKRNLF